MYLSQFFVVLNCIDHHTHIPLKQLFDGSLGVLTLQARLSSNKCYSINISDLITKTIDHEINFNCYVEGVIVSSHEILIGGKRLPFDDT